MSNVPSATSTDASTACVAIARAGVPNRGCTAAAAAGNTPSWAMAKYSRGAIICIAPRLPSTQTMTIAADRGAAAGSDDRLADLGDERLSLD